MHAIYENTEEMMREVEEMNPTKDDARQASQRVIPAEEQLELDLPDLHCYNGVDRERILLSIGGIILDVTAGAEIYGPGGGYHLFAGHEVTRCLATMSFDSSSLDDVSWVPTEMDELNILRNWIEKLMEKYPVAGRLKSGQLKLLVEPDDSAEAPATTDGSAEVYASFLATQMQAPAAILPQQP